MDKLLEQLAELKSIEITDEVKELSEKKIADMRQKTNEVVHTTNTGYGKELIPVNVLTDTVLEMVPMYAGILNAFMVGFHWNQMGKSDKVAIVGEIPFAQGNSEWTTGAGAIAQGKQLLPTGDVTINQYSMIVSVDVSNEELAYSVADLQTMILRKMSQSFVRTFESAIVNGDPETSSVGNVNSDDQAPAITFATTGWASDHRLLGWTGLRKTALAGTVDVDYKDLGTLDMSDLFVLRGLMNKYSTNLQDLVLIMDYKAYNKALTLSEFLEFQKNGVNSTAITGALSNIAGVDLFVHRDFPSTEADGKASKTASNNTKGSALYVWRPAVQRGYGKNGLDITVYKIPWKWYQFVGTMDVWFAIANKKAGETDPAVVLGINIS